MRLATFNLLHGRSLGDGLVDPQRAAKECASLDADVLGLQEVDRDQSRSGGQDLTALVAEAMGAEQHRFEPALVGTPGETWRAARDVDREATSGEAAYGVALVCRAPVEQWHVIRLAPARVTAPVLVPGSRRVVWVRDEPRVALCARTGGVTVATTHLSFVPGWNVIQLRRLVAELTRAMPPPYVLLGDLNLPGGLPRLATRWQQLANAKTYPAPRPSVQLDHALAHRLHRRVAGAQAVRLGVSDHRALVVDLA